MENLIYHLNIERDQTTQNQSSVCYFCWQLGTPRCGNYDFGWFDPFLYLNDKLNSPTIFTPQIVTPAFVRKAIEFALKHNWNITEKTAVTKVVYRDNVFNVISIS